MAVECGRTRQLFALYKPLKQGRGRGGAGAVKGRGEEVGGGGAAAGAGAAGAMNETKQQPDGVEMPFDLEDGGGPGKQGT